MNKKIYKKNLKNLSPPFCSINNLVVNSNIINKFEYTTETGIRNTFPF